MYVLFSGISRCQRSRFDREVKAASKIVGSSLTPNNYIQWQIKKLAILSQTKLTSLIILIIIIIIVQPEWHSVPWLGEGLTMQLPHLPVLRYPLISPPSSRPSSRSFPFVGFPSGDTQCPSVILYCADVPCQGPLPSSELFNHICDLCLFSYPDFFVPVCNVWHTPFHLCLW